MKKFEIKGTDDGKWLVSHNEPPKFTCLFEVHHGAHRPYRTPQRGTAAPENGTVAQGVS